jgi:putative DNA primase/helicase
MLKIGPARAGKGTTDRVQQALLGRENYTGFSLHSLAERFGTFQLVNKLLAFIGEVNLVGKERFAIMEKLNNIVGEDPVGVEEKHNPRNLSQTLPTRFSISCNEMPTFVDPAGALAARLLVVDYNKSFAGREDRELTAKLLTEISGINNWALQGYVRLRRQGTFSVPARSKALALKVRRNNSDAFAFLMDCLVVHHRLNPGGLEGVQFTDESVSVDTHTLGEAYQAWRAENQRDESSNNWLMRNLKVLLPKLDEDGNVSRKRIPCPYDPHHKTMQVQVYQGIGLKPDEPAAPSPMDAIYAPEQERGSATAPTTV